MSANAPGSANRSNDLPFDGRLDSWKEIAAFLKRDVTTVRRWEKREGLPVHRHLHERRESVYAFTTEIDPWWTNRRNHLTDNGALESVAAPAAVDPSAARHVQKAASVPLAWMTAAAFAMTTIVLGVVLFTRESTPPADTALERRFSVFPPPGTKFVTVAVSPDGRHLAFTAAPTEGARRTPTLWVRSFDSLEARALPDTDDAAFPFWSPASDALGFFASGHLWTVGLAGGSPRSIAVALDARGGTWNRDGTIVFAPEHRGALYRVASGGGAATAVTVLGDGERGHIWPEFLPDGTHLLYVAHAGTGRDEDHHVFVAALDGTERRRILSAQSTILYSADGYLHYQRERRLFAQPFDIRRFELTGDPVAVAGRVEEHSGYPRKTEFSVSSRGILAYRAPQRSATRLVWRDRAGRPSPLLMTPADYYSPTFAPNESRVAYALFDPEPSGRFGYGPAKVSSDLYVHDRTTGLSSQITSDPAAEWGPVWSPDGRSMVFSSNRRNDTLELFLKDMTNANALERPLDTKGLNPVGTSWSPDGRFIVYSVFDRRTRGDIWCLPMSGDRTPIPLLQGEFTEEQGQISPDGRWLAYTSTESGRPEVWVTTLPRVTTKWQISSGGAGDPRWGPDGRELFYITEDRQLMAVPIRAGASFAHGDAERLFDTALPPHWYEARNLYDVGRDGRFLFMTPVEDDRSAPVTVVLNWAARLKRR